MTGQLDAILSYVAKLDELDVTTVVAVHYILQQVVNAFREDEARPSLPRKLALAKWTGTKRRIFCGSQGHG